MADPVRILLASGSPRRRELLGRLGCEVEVVVPDVDESALPGEAPRELVRRLARAKADAVPAPDDVLVVAGDTIVVLDGTVLGKPGDEAEAERMLLDLSGRTHEVLSGYALRRGGQTIDRVVSVPVTMTAFDDEAIRWYLGTGEWRGKAGAYAIQGRGAALVASITGDPTAVIGLPLSAMIADARSLGSSLLAK